METEELTLQDACYEVISEHFDQYLCLENVPHDLQLTILISELKKHNDEVTYWQDSDDSDAENSETENNTVEILHKIIDLLHTTILPKSEVCFIAEELLEHVKQNDGFSLLDACNDMEETNQQRLSEILVKYAFDARVFNYFTQCFDVMDAQPTDVLAAAEFSAKTPQYTASVEKGDKNVFLLHLYNKEDLVEKTIIMPQLGHSILLRDPRKEVAYHEGKKIIAIPGYRNAHGKDCCAEVFFDIIWADSIFYTAQNMDVLPFEDLTNENKISRVLCTEQFDKILLVTKNGRCLDVTLPRCIPALINRELSFQEILFLVSLLMLHDKVEDYNGINVKFLEFLKNHEILEHLAQKNEHLAQSVRMFIDELYDAMKQN